MATSVLEAKNRRSFQVHAADVQVCFACLAFRLSSWHSLGWVSSVARWSHGVYNNDSPIQSAAAVYSEWSAGRLTESCLTSWFLGSLIPWSLGPSHCVKKWLADLYAVWKVGDE